MNISKIINLIVKPFQMLADYENLKQDNAMIKAKYLYWVCRAGLEMAVYKRNSLGRGATYCNIFAFEIMDSRTRGLWHVNVKEGATEEFPFAMGGEIEAFDYDISCLMTDNNIDMMLNTGMDISYKQGLIAEKNGEIISHSPESAQDIANSGIPIMVFSLKYGHAAIVIPNLQHEDGTNNWEIGPYDPELGPFTANAGQHNDVMYMSDKRGFGYYNWKDPEIRYWEFPEFE